ncbi:MAG: glycosyltransferase [Candidatus Omnitrophota bacterium]|nr:glycosyltransferase [Candidatus Omnitrophota bacterium]
MNQPRHKILFLITGLTVGGAEKLLLQHLRCLDRSRFEPIVATLYCHNKLSGGEGDDLHPQFAEFDVPVRELAMRHKLDFSVLERVRKLLLEEKPDILHTHLAMADWIGRVVGHFCRVPLIVGTLHAVEPWRKWFPLNLIDLGTSRWADALIAVSEEVRDGIVRLQGLDASRIHIIPNGIDYPTADNSERSKIRRSLNVPEDALVIGTLGRLDESVKGHGTLLEAAKSLAVKHDRFHCVFVGDGPSRSHLEKQAAGLGLANRVTFAGMRQDVAPWLSAMDVFVQPSHQEGLPLAVLEAMAAGRPIVATRVGGIPEVIKDRHTGLLVEPKDSNALATAVTEIVEDHALAGRLARGAQAHFRKHYDMRHLINKIQSFYEEQLRKKTDKRVKVLEVVTSLDTGGVTTYLENLWRFLPADRFDVSVASGLEDFQADRARSLNMPHHPVALVKRIHPWKDVQAVWQLCRLIRRERIGMVHTNMAKADWVGALAARLCGVKTIVSTAHGATTVTPGPSLAQSVFDFIEKVTYRCLHTHVISVSRATSEHLTRKKAISWGRLSTVWNGMNCDEESAPLERAAMRDKLGLKADQPVVTMVGRLKYPKAPEVLLESMRKLATKRPDLACLIVGDGPDAASLKKRVCDYGLEKNVQLLGHRQDVRDILHASDLFVLSSYSEGLSLSVLEAMAQRLPIIATRAGGNTEIVADGTTGLLVTPGSESELTRAIESLLTDAERRQRLGNQAWERLQTHFDARSQAKKTERIFQNCLKHPEPWWMMFFTWFNPINRLQRYYREEGLANTWKRLFKFLITPFYRVEDLWFLGCENKKPIPQLKGRIPFKIRRATVEDLDSLMEIDFDDPQTVVDLLESPQDICFVADNGGEIMAVQWVRLGVSQFDINPFNRAVALAADEAYLYNCRSKHLFRAQGIVPAMECQIYAWLCDKGYSKLYTDITAENTVSLKTFEKLGLRKIECVRFSRILRRVGVRCRRYRLDEHTPVRSAILRDCLYSEDPHGNYSRHLPPDLFKPLLVTVPEKTGPTLFGFLGKVFSVYRCLRRGKAEIVHCESRGSLLCGILAARLAGVSSVTAYAHPIESYRMSNARAFERWLWKKIPVLLKQTQLYFPAETLREEWETLGWASKQNSAVIPIDKTVQDFKAELTSDENRRYKKIKKIGPTLGAVLPLSADLLARRVMDIFAEVKKRRPDCQFLLAGDGPVFLVLKQYQELVGLSDNMQIVNRRFESGRVMKAVDLYIDMNHPKTGEQTRMEAMAAELPIFSGNLKGESEAVAAERIVELLANPAELSIMSQASRVQGEKDFEARYFAGCLQAAWYELLSLDTRPAPADKWRNHASTSLSR